MHIFQCESDLRGVEPGPLLGETTNFPEMEEELTAYISIGNASQMDKNQ
jgi:hypothetical protein